jgi:hypothetical protein
MQTCCNMYSLGIQCKRQNIPDHDFYSYSVLNRLITGRTVLSYFASVSSSETMDRWGWQYGSKRLGMIYWTQHVRANQIEFATRSRWTSKNDVLQMQGTGHLTWRGCDIMCYGFFLKKYSYSQCCWKKYSDFGGRKKNNLIQSFCHIT